MNLNGLPIVALVLSVSFVSGCLLESESSESEPLVVRSDQAVYSTEEAPQIGIENRTGKPVFFPRCDTLVYDIERRQDGNWERLGGTNFCTTDLPMAPIELEEGEEREVEVRNLSEGVYRFVVGYGFKAESAGEMEVASNQFKIEAK